MFIYSAIRFGNDHDGPDGDDTEFIVLAPSVHVAAEIVDKELKKAPHNRVAPFCHAIAVVGKSYSTTEHATVLMGPNVTHMSRFDVGLPDDNIWRRQGDSQNGSWIQLKDY